MVMALDDQLWEPEHSWRDEAACAGADSDVFFTPGEEEALAMPAKKVVISPSLVVLMNGSVLMITSA